MEAAGETAAGVVVAGATDAGATDAGATETGAVLVTGALEVTGAVEVVVVEVPQPAKAATSIKEAKTTAMVFFMGFPPKILIKLAWKHLSCFSGLVDTST